MSRTVLIDVSAAVNQSAGIGRYARSLTAHLLPMLSAHQTQLWLASDPYPHDAKLLHRSPWSAFPSQESLLSRRLVDRLYFRHQLPVGPLLRVPSASDVYSPDFTAPVPAGARTHITVHDLAWLHAEADSPPALARYLEPVVKRAIDSAVTVFTVSETIRREVIERFRLPEERVIVASNAASAGFFGAPPLDKSELAMLGVRDPFILYVGTIEPRKNLSVLFHAMTQLPAELTLVLAGKMGWTGEQILGQITDLDLSSRIVCAGFVPDDQLARLIASASTLVYPSRYEGFGLPIVEALAAGTPVAASDLPVFHEVGGSEVVYFDSTDPQSMARSIEEAIGLSAPDPSARVRRLARARRFSWQSSASIVAKRLAEMN